jgi:hypothetical protein
MRRLNPVSVNINTSPMNPGLMPVQKKLLRPIWHDAARRRVN